MRVAIVGAGVSGLVAARLLHQARHEVVVFEAASYAGGHTNTIRVPTPRGDLDVDTGFIVLNDRNYPTFTRLLEHLGVATQASEMSFSVSATHEDFEYAGTPRGLLAQPRNLARPWFQRMVAEYVRFNRDARRLLLDGDSGTSLRDWLGHLRYSRPFIDKLLIPQASAVWSADPAHMWNFPARFLVRFFDQHGMLSLRNRPRWSTVAGGSARYVEALVAPFVDRIRLATPVASVRRHDDHVTVVPRGGDAERFDHVVLATHSDQALRLLADPTDREHELLGAIPYQDNEAVLHTDTALLPRRRPAWSSWNFHLLPEQQTTARATVTYHMNTLQRLRTDQHYCVTLNRSEAIDPEHIIRRMTYAHPVFTPEGWAAQARHHEISGVNRTHYAGAYWRWGFHEDGVVSAVRAAERLGGRMP